MSEKRDAFRAELARKSIDVITTFQNENGSYHASPKFVAYKGYCWLRDGAFIADAMSTAGEINSANQFFNWVHKTLCTHKDLFAVVVERTREGKPPEAEKMPPTRFGFDGTIKDDGWENFQLDGYGTWLWAVVEHAKRHGEDIHQWRESIELTTWYLVTCWDRNCYDWWEEHLEQQHVSTLGCIQAGLESVVTLDLFSSDEKVLVHDVIKEIQKRISMGGTRGHLTKWIGTDEVDGSLAALISPMNVIDPMSSEAEKTISAIEKDLCFNNGVHRFRADKFYGGGQWPLLSCFLGLAHLKRGNRERAEELLDWAASTITKEGMMPEQVDWHLLDAAHRPYWLERWKEPAVPLLWSHAVYLRLYLSLTTE